MVASRRAAGITAVLLSSIACAAPVKPDQGPSNNNGAERDLSAVVYACVNRKGELQSAEIDRSSGYPEIDEAALKVAKATKFAPGKNRYGKVQRKSCLRFKVVFVIKDGEPVPVSGAPPPAG